MKILTREGVADLKQLFDKWKELIEARTLDKRVNYLYLSLQILRKNVFERIQSLTYGILTWQAYDMLVYFLFRIQSAIRTFCGEFHEFQELNMSQSLVFCKWVRCRMRKSLRKLCHEIKPNSGNKKSPPWNLAKHKNIHLKHWRQVYKYKRKREWVKLMAAIGVRVNGNTKKVEWTHSHDQGHDTASFFLHWNDDFEYIYSRTYYIS